MTDKKDQHHNDTTGKQGFASMSHDKVQEIARKGGQSHGHNHQDDSDYSEADSAQQKNARHYDHSEQPAESDPSHEKDHANHEHGKQGFASMPHDKVQKIARKGGQSHGHNNDQD